MRSWILMNNYIYEYYQAITDGQIVVGKWVRLWYALVIKKLKKKEFFYDAKKAQKAIRFIEAFCHHHEGELAPSTIKLELWQKAFLSVVFGIVDADGFRTFREILLIVGRKNGKTLLSSAIANYMMFADGEYGARIYFCAPKLEQAELCYDGFYQMILQEPELDELAKRRRTDIEVESTNSKARKLAYNSKKADGLNPSCAICDEIGAWGGANGFKQYEVIKSALGARKQPIVLSITTANYEDGIYDELMKRATSVILESSNESRLAPFLYMIDDVEKWNDINELQKSNPNMNVSVSVDFFLEEIAIAESSLSKKAEFICKYACIKQNSHVAWLDATTVEKTTCKHLELEDFRNSYAVLGIDLSHTIDLSCATLVIEREGILNVFSRFYLPKNKIDEATARDNIPYRTYVQRGLLFESGENFIDYQDIYDWCRELVEEYQIYPLKVGYDRYSATYLVNDLKAYGFQTDDVYQGENLTPVIQEVEGLMKDGKIKIGDNDLMKIHFLNSALKVNSETERKKLIKIESRAHIDGMASFLDAMCVRQKWFNEIGEQLRNE